MTSIPRLRPDRLVILIPLLFGSVFPVLSQETAGISAERLLEDALFFTVDMAVNSADGEKELWASKVEKITIPGRAVDVDLEGLESRLSVSFTPYPAESGTLILVARSETWVAGDYSSSLASIPIAYRDEVYYYPLGRAEDGTEDNPVEVRMIINVVPYLDTLDEAARAALESAFDSSAQFNLSGEDG